MPVLNLDAELVGLAQLLAHECHDALALTRLIGCDRIGECRQIKTPRDCAANGIRIGAGGLKALLGQQAEQGFEEVQPPWLDHRGAHALAPFWMASWVMRSWIAFLCSAESRLSWTIISHAWRSVSVC